MYIYTTYDLINKINSLNKSQKKILIMIVIIIILLIGIVVLRNNLEKNVNNWDYKKINNINGVDEIISDNNITKNRVIYWELTNIINKYIDTIVNDDYKKDNNFYDVLTKEYRKSIDEKEYRILEDEFAYRFVYSSGNDREYIKTDYRIKDIYSYGDNMYLCYLSVNLDEMSDNEISLYYNNDNEDIAIDRKSNGYIGIKLNEANETYEIFYLE